MKREAIEIDVAGTLAFDRTDVIAEVRLVSTRWVSEGVMLCEFIPIDGRPLWQFSAGSHVDLHLPNGLTRQYSLVNPQHETRSYVLGIKRDANSRGGSSFIHDGLRLGSILQIGRPRNNFPLNESAESLVFVAGGIGVTPLLCMAQRASELGLNWRLHYAVRKRTDAAFLDIIRPRLDRCVVHVDDEHEGRPLDVAAVLTDVASTAHVYCCGPEPMLDSFRQAVSTWPAAQVHVEHFNAAPVKSNRGFLVTLARSGIDLEVQPGQSILQAVRGAGIVAPSACEQGICGACETRVLSGTPDHRDLLLSDEDRVVSKTMMICCSGCIGDRLVLDL